jgi:uncharacterized protein YndB with AHSA1/START domain
MAKKTYRPSALAKASVERDGERWTLVFVRELRHAPASVWRALTAPDALREWAPFDADRDMAKPGAVTLTMAGEGESETFACTIRRAEENRVLEHTWDEDVLRWELEPIDGGTRLTLRHSTPDRSMTPKTAAGWHICLDVMERWLSNEPVGRVVGPDAKEHGWPELNAKYEQRFASAAEE